MKQGTEVPQTLKMVKVAVFAIFVILVGCLFISSFQLFNRRIMAFHKYLIFNVLLIIVVAANAQKKTHHNNTLFTAGHAAAFIGGLYEGYYPYSELKHHGNFGLGAPDLLDGELLVLNGKIYQTQASGKTFELKNGKALTPFSVVNFFSAQKTAKTAKGMSKDALYAYLDSVMPDQNSIYAIHIKGKFANIKTRAFPPVNQKPYAALATMLPLQQFFSLDDTTGDLVGYRIPAYMDGPNITGYHFHFLSANKQHGGHMIGLLSGDLVIEIQQLNSFTVDLPNTADFAKFDFKKDRSEEIKKVENGKN